MIMEAIDNASATLASIDAKMAGLGATTAATATKVETSGASLEKAAGGMGSALSLAGFSAAKAWLAALGPIALVAGVVALLVGMAKTAEDDARAQNDLAVAFKEAGLEVTKYQQRIDDFIHANARWIGNINEVKTGLAELVRQGHSYEESMRIINIAIDYSTAQHMSLKDAITQVGLATQGRGRALLDLGIKMKDYPALMEGEVQADKKIELAKKAVQKATEELDKAQHAYTKAVNSSHVPAQKSLHEVTVTLDAVMNGHVGTHSKLQAAHAKSTAGASDHYAASMRLSDAQKKLKEATDNLAKAQDFQNEKSREQQKLLDTLHTKTKDARNAQTEVEQSTHQLGAAWDHLSDVVGPPLLELFSKLVDSLAWILDHAAAVLNFFDKLGGVGGQKAWQQQHDKNKLFGGDIKVFGAGGIVTGPTLALIGEDGPEAVVPLGKGVGMGSMAGGAGGGGGGNVYVDLRGSFLPDTKAVDQLYYLISKRLAQTTVPSAGIWIRK